VINECLMLAHNQPPDASGTRRSRGCVVRNSFPDLNSTTIPDWRAITDLLPFGTFTMGSPPMWKAEYKRSDGTKVQVEVLFRSFDGPQDDKKARGMQLTWLWLNEAAELEKSNVDLLIGRVKRYPPPAVVPDARYSVIMDMNAPDRDHWMASMALDHTPDSWEFFIQPPAVIQHGSTWVTNPAAENLHNLAKDYYKDQVGGKKESWIRKNLANQFVHHSSGRPIHPDFNEQLHVGEVQPTPGIPLHIGIDFGRTPAATIGQRQVDGQWYVLAELVTQNMGADKFGKLLRALLNERYSTYEVASITGDPSGTAMAQTRDETPFDLLSLSGLEAYPASTNDPLIRYAAMDNQLTSMVGGQPAIMIDPGCKVLIRGLAGEYEFKRVMVAGSERYHDKPDKGPTSHVCEASHYMLMGAGEGEMMFDQAHMGVMADLKEFEYDYAAFE
jgi:hypothetical protein